MRNHSHHSVGRDKLQAFIFLCTQQVEELDQTRKDILNTQRLTVAFSNIPENYPKMMVNGRWSFEVEQKIRHWSMAKPHPQEHRGVAEIHFFYVAFCYWLFNDSFPLILHLLSDDSLKTTKNNRGLYYFLWSHLRKTRIVNLTQWTPLLSYFHNLLALLVAFVPPHTLTHTHSSLIPTNACCSNEAKSELPCFLSFAKRSQSQCITQGLLAPSQLTMAKRCFCSAEH